MYGLEALKKTLTEIASLRQKADQIESEENKKAILAQYGGDHGSIYAPMFGQLSATASMVARSVEFALKNLDTLIKQVELLERLQTVMENFDVMANNGWDGKEDNTRELRLLEILTTNDNYSYERRQLYNAIAKTLNGVEESEAEEEQESATESLEKVGFVNVETDDFDGLERGNERVKIETHRKNGNFGYQFSYTRGGNLFLQGVSGEFNKLLEAVGVPVAA